MFYDEPEPFHDVALICLNGHVVNDRSRTSPQLNAKHCDKCGEPTIDSCPSCRKPIQGHYHSPHVIVAFGSHAPRFCQECGKAFPWTERRLIAAKELANELEELTNDDKLKLQNSLDDLAREGPKVEPAKFRFTQIMKKVSREGYDMMKTVVTDIVSETVRKAIYGPK